MKKENLHQPFEISVKELEESPLKEHEHTFFELVYILSGTGLQCINNNKFYVRIFILCFQNRILKQESRSYDNLRTAFYSKVNGCEACSI